MEELKLERAGDDNTQGTEVMAKILGFKLRSSMIVFILQDWARDDTEHGLRRGPERKWRDQSGSCHGHLHRR